MGFLVTNHLFISDFSNLIMRFRAVQAIKKHARGELSGGGTMSIASLIIGFILGAVSTIIFTSTLKSSGDKLPGEKRLKINPLLGVFLLVPILAGLIYWKAGSPDAVSVSTPATTMPPAGMGSTQPMGEAHEMGDLGAMAQKLAAKLEKSPENADGWALLAHTYVELKQHKDAVSAFEKAVNLISNDPQLFADYADALAVTNNSKFDAKSIELVDQALKIDPNHPKALLLAGTIAFNQADYTKAIGMWERLQPLISKEDTTLMKHVAGNIAEAKALINKKQ
jgi:cytochrome c-type biogenesis protein CcmH